MKRLITVFFALTMCLGVFAQSEETKEKVNKAKDRLVFELNSGYLLHDQTEGYIQKGFQRGMNVYFMYDLVIKKSNFSIAPGIGIGTENWYNKSRITYTDSLTVFTPFSFDTINVKSSKLGLTYIDIPLELRFRSKPNDKNWQWKLAAGFKIGFLLHSKWKYKGEEFRGIRNDSEGNIKFKEFGIPNMDRLRYGVTARGGYGPFNLHIYYSLSKLFNQGAGPDLQPIVFGISINGL